MKNHNFIDLWEFDISHKNMDGKLITREGCMCRNCGTVVINISSDEVDRPLLLNLNVKIDCDEQSRINEVKKLLQK